MNQHKSLTFYAVACVCLFVCLFLGMPALNQDFLIVQAFHLVWKEPCLENSPTNGELQVNLLV